MLNAGMLEESIDLFTLYVDTMMIFICVYLLGWFSFALHFAQRLSESIIVVFCTMGDLHSIF
jgi:hypothetical protein